MFNFFNNSRKESAGKAHRKGARKPRQQRTLANVEMLERREMMTAGIAGPVISTHATIPMAIHLASNDLVATSGYEAGITTSSSITSNLKIATPLNDIAIISKLHTPPAGPVFTETAVSGSEIDLAWKSVSSATGYVVDEWVNGAWTTIGNLGSSATSDKVTGLNANSTYYFDVEAYNSYGATWGNFKSVTTVDLPTAATSYSVATGSLFGSNGPSYLDVEQGQVGDCWLLASLAETAARDPNDIRNMFTPAGSTVVNGVTNNFYTVHLYNNAGAKVNITVDSELPSGGGEYDHPANGVLWVALAEKAYAQANGQSLVTSGDKGSDSYAALNNGDPSWALHAITGKASNDYSINPTNIAAAWKANQLIVLTTSTPVSVDIVGSHCYAVVGYNASASLPFEVYNPWGTNSSGWALSTDNGNQVWGLFDANAAFLSQNFAWQSIGTGQAVTSSNPSTDASQHTNPLTPAAVSAIDAEMTKVSSLVSHDTPSVLDSIVKGGSLSTHAIDALFAQWHDDARLDFTSPVHS